MYVEGKTKQEVKLVAYALEKDGFDTRIYRVGNNWRVSFFAGSALTAELLLRVQRVSKIINPETKGVKKHGKHTKK